MENYNLFDVAAYIRLSCEDGDKEESNSVGNQRKLINEYISKHDDFRKIEYFVERYEDDLFEDVFDEIKAVPEAIGDGITILNHDDERRFIEKATIKEWDMLCGILSKYVLGGQTRATLWNEAVKERIFYLVIQKMCDIIEFWDKQFAKKS